MAFSIPQQKEYRALVETAWQKHCRRNAANPKDRAAKDLWTRDHLEAATGHRSSKDCNPGRHFDRACAHLEAQTQDGIKYQLRLISGDLGRIRYAIRDAPPEFLAQFRDDKALCDWLRGIAQQMLTLSTPPELYDLTDDQIAAVTKFACIAAARAARP